MITNKKQLNDIGKVTRCINCGRGKYGVKSLSTLSIAVFDERSKCCDDPTYYWEWEDRMLCELPYEIKSIK